MTEPTRASEHPTAARANREHRWAPWLIWLLGVAVAVVVLLRGTIVTDVSAFLPGPATTQQRLLIGQLKDGLATRLMIVGITTAAPALTSTAEAAPTAADQRHLADLSEALREVLANDRDVLWVNNGSESAQQSLRELLFSLRYQLSPGVTAERYSEAGLRQALLELDRALQQSTDPVLRQIVRSIAQQDPTLESLKLLEQAQSRQNAHRAHGVWMTPDRRHALLLLETALPGQDLVGQQQLMQRIQRQFAGLQRPRTPTATSDPVAELSQQAPGDGRAEVQFAGPAYFGVEAKKALEADAGVLSLIATVLVASLLVWATRSPRLLGLAAIPVASGALAGLAAVMLLHGSIHGITLAFGVTLIGEAVDYVIYAYIQRESDGRHAPRFWRQILLATLTSGAGFAAMIVSGFQGLQQLGVFSIVGLATAAACTRWLLPVLFPQTPPKLPGQTLEGLPRLAARLRKLQPLGWTLMGAAAIWLSLQGTRLWNDNLDLLSAATPQANERDHNYRTSLGMPDLRLMLAIRGDTRDAALAHAELISAKLQALTGDSNDPQSRLQGFDSPTLLLPSEATQAKRRHLLPDHDQLQSRLQRATEGGPFRAQAFEPFVQAIEQARNAPLLSIDTYQRTPLASWLTSQVISDETATAGPAAIPRQDLAHTVLIPLRGLRHPSRLMDDLCSAPEQSTLTPARRTGGSGSADADRGLTHACQHTRLLDLQTDVERLVADYRERALIAFSIGTIAILALLAAQIRRVQAVRAMSLALLSTVALTAAIMALWQGSLTLFNLIALLLVVGVTSNYTMFLATLAADPALRHREGVSVLLAASSTFCAFAMLAMSSSPVLAMIGKTVATGAAVGVLASMVFSPPQTFSLTDNTSDDDAKPAPNAHGSGDAPRAAT